jgi:hypothetical protein
MGDLAAAAGRENGKGKRHGHETTRLCSLAERATARCRRQKLGAGETVRRRTQAKAGGRMKRRLLTLLSAALLAACGKGAEHLAWKQEVPLQDGRVVVLDRLSYIGPEALLMNRLRMEVEQTLAFTHPDGGQRIEWKIPKGLLPFLLDFDAGVPYYVFYAHTVGDYNRWECPNPPYLVFKHAGGQWQRIPFEELPLRFVKPNLVDMAEGNRKFMVNGLVAKEVLPRYFKQYRADRNRINREKIDANVKGCFPSVLIKLGRANEITEPIGVPTSSKGEQK